MYIKQKKSIKNLRIRKEVKKLQECDIMNSLIDKIEKPITEADLRNCTTQEVFEVILFAKSLTSTLISQLPECLLSQAFGCLRGSYMITETYSRIPLIQNFDENSCSGKNEYEGNIGNIVINSIDSPMVFKDKIPIASELEMHGDGYRYSTMLVCHEIMNRKLDIDEIIEKYENTGCILSYNAYNPMKCIRSPIIIWAWQKEISWNSIFLSEKQKELLGKGALILAPLEILMKAAPDFFDESVREKYHIWDY